MIVHEHAGVARFADQHTVETEDGLRLQAEKIIICTGGVSRRLSVPGIDLASTHSDAWNLTSVPSSMLVIGAGATGVQIASIFNAFGSRIQLFQTGPRILPSEDEDVSAAVAAAFRESGIVVHENFGAVESFEKTPDGGANDLLQERQPGERRGDTCCPGGRLGRRYCRAEARYRRASRPIIGGSCRLMGICGLLRPIFSPLGTLPVARCWSLRQYRRASWRLPTPCEVRL